ncbi:hypothetical protein K432DRAFT_397589 [Lepidopterella palustris CBS 459.81]|uniref:Uncharacterized protein n=1 Tax=Lepidopterella palustris CBS 459.81 TaxID=1314670 RepID=A0A8E2JA58_9PEZI|nr:hypothetical protein K432DRAFT_397589 [Lepidopterella palustris CBS 459.81]
MASTGIPTCDNADTPPSIWYTISSAPPANTPLSTSKFCLCPHCYNTLIAPHHRLLGNFLTVANQYENEKPAEGLICDFNTQNHLNKVYRQKLAEAVDKQKGWIFADYVRWLTSIPSCRNKTDGQTRQLKGGGTWWTNDKADFTVCEACYAEAVVGTRLQDTLHRTKLLESVETICALNGERSRARWMEACNSLQRPDLTSFVSFQHQRWAAWNEHGLARDRLREEVQVLALRQKYAQDMYTMCASTDAQLTAISMTNLNATTTTTWGNSTFGYGHHSVQGVQAQAHLREMNELGQQVALKAEEAQAEERRWKEWE